MIAMQCAANSGFLWPTNSRAALTKAMLPEMLMALAAELRFCGLADRAAELRQKAERLMAEEVQRLRREAGEVQRLRREAGEVQEVTSLVRYCAFWALLSITTTSEDTRPAALHSPQRNSAALLLPHLQRQRSSTPAEGIQLSKREAPGGEQHDGRGGYRVRGGTSRVTPARAPRITKYMFRFENPFTEENKPNPISKKSLRKKTGQKNPKECHC